MEIRASYAVGLAAAAAQKSVAMEPRWIGSEFPVLRKPARKATMVQDGFLWIDAEDFADYGGWRLDTQFVHLMGSGYLIAASVGVPVRDASTEVEIPRPGKYRLWVREELVSPLFAGQVRGFTGWPTLAANLRHRRQRGLDLAAGRRLPIAAGPGAARPARSVRLLRPLRCDRVDYRHARTFRLKSSTICRKSGAGSPVFRWRRSLWGRTT